MQESQNDNQSSEFEVETDTLKKHLKELLSKTKPENRHEEIDFGREGKEQI